MTDLNCFVLILCVWVFASMHVCAPHLGLIPEGQSQYWMPWNLSYQWLWTTTLLLRIEPKSSARATVALNQWTSSPGSESTLDLHSASFLTSVSQWYPAGTAETDSGLTNKTKQKMQSQINVLNTCRSVFFFARVSIWCSVSSFLSSPLPSFPFLLSFSPHSPPLPPLPPSWGGKPSPPSCLHRWPTFMVVGKWYTVTTGLGFWLSFLELGILNKTLPSGRTWWENYEHMEKKGATAGGHDRGAAGGNRSSSCLPTHWVALR